jgi:hypothetical protein
LSNYLTPMGDPGRSRLPASIRRELEAIRRETLITNMAFSAIDHLALKGMIGQKKLCEEGRFLASGDPFVGSQMQMWVNWAQLAKMGEASDALCRLRRY